MGGYRRFKAVMNVTKRFDAAMNLNPDAYSVEGWKKLLQERIYYVLTAPIDQVKADGWLSDRMPYTIDYETRGVDRENRTIPAINISVRL